MQNAYCSYQLAQSIGRRPLVPAVVVHVWYAALQDKFTSVGATFASHEVSHPAS